MCDLQKRFGLMQGLIKDGEWHGSEYLPRYARALTLLAAALDDKNLKDRTAYFFQPILNCVKASGDFSPPNNSIQAPKIEAIKALLTYYEFTNSPRVLSVLKRYFKNQFNTHGVIPTWYNERARLLEEISAVETVYRETDLEWLRDLAEKLRDDSNDWFKLASKFPYKKAANKYVSGKRLQKIKKTVATSEKQEDSKLLDVEFIAKQWKKQQKDVELNGVNLAKALKYPAVYGRFVGDDSLKELSKKLYAAVQKFHGTPVGAIACDTHLLRRSPTGMIDVQAAVETVDSLIEVIKETGDYKLVDVLERIIFNVIPAACFQDCSAVQDSLSINQIEASADGKAAFSESEFANAYLTKKLSRGGISVLAAFPLYMQAACMVHDNELNFLTYTPCEMDIIVDGGRLTISEKTGYPFRNSVVFKVEYADGEPEVNINFRVPSGVTMQLISGGQVVATGNKVITVKCVLRTGSTFMLKMDIPLTVEDNSDGTYSLFKGNVLMSLKMPCDVKASKEDSRIFNLNVIRKWSVAPIFSRRQKNGIRSLADEETTIVNNITNTPFSFDKAPFELKIRCKNVMNWEIDQKGNPILPEKPVFSDESLERTFIPFGCSLLHIAQFPKCVR